MDTIRNPIEWTLDQLKQSGLAMRSTGHSLHGTQAGPGTYVPAVRRITAVDLREVLVRGFQDFGACRTDVIFIVIVYPLGGLILAQFASQHDLLPLLFPLASGFALIGPVAAVGLYEMSRRREQGLEVSWADSFGVIGSPSFGAILVLGLLLLVIFLLWLLAAQVIYMLTLGPEPPASIAAFVSDVLTTAAGWAMIIVGVGVGFLFAVAVLAISVVSFPLLLDQDVGLGRAIATSVQSVIVNPVPMAMWGLVIAGGLVIGTIPLFLGLIVVLPVLGHATWHLYRKVVYDAAQMAATQGSALPSGFGWAGTPRRREMPRTRKPSGAKAAEFDHRNVGIVALIIGGAVLVLGLGGLVLHVS